MVAWGTWGPRDKDLLSEGARERERGVEREREREKERDRGRERGDTRVNATYGNAYAGNTVGSRCVRTRRPSGRLRHIIEILPKTLIRKVTRLEEDVPLVVFYTCYPREKEQERERETELIETNAIRDCTRIGLVLGSRGEIIELW